MFLPHELVPATLIKAPSPLDGRTSRGEGRRWLLDLPPRTRAVLAVPSQWPGLAWGRESPYFLPFPQLGIISPLVSPKGF